MRESLVTDRNMPDNKEPFLWACFSVTGILFSCLLNDTEKHGLATQHLFQTFLSAQEKDSQHMISFLIGGLSPEEQMLDS